MFVAFKTLLITLLIFSAMNTATAGQRGLHRNALSAVTDSGQSIKLYEQSHALLIGVSDYTDGWSDLEAIPEELDAVENALVKKGFNVVRVRNPDSRQMKAAFEDFINDYGHDSNNRLLFFYSGHGHSDKRRGYLVPSDAPLADVNPKDFRRRSLDMDQMLAWARKIDAKHALFLFDSCFSGSIFKAKNMPSAKERLITGATNQSVRQFITAGSAGETVPARSTFTPAFVRAINDGEGDINQDGYITGSELGFHLSQIVPESVDQTPQYGKIRDWDLQKGDFVFINKISIQTSQSDTRAGDTSAIEVTYWKSAEKQGSLPAYELYLNKFPGGEFKELAQLQISTLKLKEDREQQAEAKKIEQELTKKHDKDALKADVSLWERSRSLATTTALRQYVDTCQAPCQQKKEALQLLEQVLQNKRAFSRHLKNNELTTGKKGTALQSVLAVESIAPNDPWVNASKEIISERYTDLAESHILAKRYSQARISLQKANEIALTDRVGALFARLQQRESQEKLALEEKIKQEEVTSNLTIHVTPNNAHIEFLDYDKKYKAGMALDTLRSYKLKVSKPGFQSYEKIHHFAAGSRSLRITLLSEEVHSLTRLNVAVTPVDSVIKILNIKPNYKDGISLKTGVNYRIYVSKPGYRTYDKYHKFKEGDQSLNITLQPKTAIVKERPKIASSNEVLLDLRFNAAGVSKSSSSKKYETKISNGYLHFKHKLKKQWQSHNYHGFELDQSKNFEITAKFWKKIETGNPDPKLNYGVSLSERRSGGNRHSFFLIGDGKYSYQTVVNGKSSNTIPWKSSSTIDKDKRGGAWNAPKNDIRIVKQQDQIIFYINGERVNSKSYQEIPGDGSNLQLSIVAYGQHAFLIDHLAIKYLN